MGCVAKGVCGTRGVPMSRYGYDYSLAPSRPSGWRSLFRNVLTIVAVAAISAISGAVVALDLLGGGPTVADRSTVVRPAQAASLHVAPSASQPASAPTIAPAPVQTGAAAPVQQLQAPASVPVAQPTVQPAIAPAPQAAPTPQSVPTASAAPIEAPKTVQVPDSELTFRKGYARRHPVQEAATTGSGAQVAPTGLPTQIRHPPAKARSKTTVARQNGPQDQNGGFFARHQALAFGDQRDSHANRRPQQQSGVFGGGFFRSLF
jgi:hypothetical protein